MKDRRFFVLLIVALLVVGASVVITIAGGLPYTEPESEPTQAVSQSPVALPTEDTQIVQTPDINADIEVAPNHASLIDQSEGELCIQVIDVKHGDAILVISPAGRTMLIDTGEGDQRKALKTALDKAGIERIDILQLTHPHSDHIGNAPWVLRNYPVGEVHMIDKAHTTKTYEELLDALEETSVPITKIEPGVSFDFDGVHCEYIGPLNTNYRSMNNCSAVMRMTYGEKSFLFMGDMEVIAERDLVSKLGESLNVDFLKVGHHATNSTEDAFAEIASPEVSIISSKPLKSYTSPEQKQAVVDRLANQGSLVYITGSYGTITVTCDGTSLKTQYAHEPDSVDMEMTIPTPSPAFLIETEPLSKHPRTSGVLDATPAA